MASDDVSSRNCILLTMLSTPSAEGRCEEAECVHASYLATTTPTARVCLQAALLRVNRPGQVHPAAAACDSRGQCAWRGNRSRERPQLVRGPTLGLRLHVWPAPVSLCRGRGAGRLVQHQLCWDASSAAAAVHVWEPCERGHHRQNQVRSACHWQADSVSLYAGTLRHRERACGGNVCPTGTCIGAAVQGAPVHCSAATRSLWYPRCHSAERKSGGEVAGFPGAMEPY